MKRSENSIAVLLRITAFRRMWLALSTSSLGDWLGLLATTALAAYLTKDSSNLAQGAAVSGVLVTRLAPDLILGPIAGALVDRLDRRYVAIVGDTIAGVLYLSIPLAGNLTWLLVAQFLVEAVGLFSNPAKQALWVNIVPRERLAVANQLNYVSVYGMVPVAAVLFALLATITQFFGAPPVPSGDTAGALISGTSSIAINVALIFDAATYFLAATVLFATRSLIPAFLGERETAKSVFSLVREGIGFVKNSRVMRAIYVGILGAFAAGGLVAGVAQAYVATMGGGNAGYGILFGAVFSGLALGMLIGPKVLPAVSRRIVFTLAIGAAGVALVVMSLIPDFVGAAVTSVVMGIAAGIAWITGFTMIGHEVADRLRGRVFAFVMSSVRIMLLGTIAAGPILANGIGQHRVSIGAYELVFTGPGLVLAASGVITVVVAIFAGRQVGGLRGHFLGKLGRRLLRGRRRDFLDVDESLPGAFVSVVGADGDANARYADAVVSHLDVAGWVTSSVRQNVAAWRADDSEPDALRALAELSELVSKRVRPALVSGDVVVCRDYRDATVARFGVGAGLGEERLLRMAEWSTGGLAPDLVILVDAGDDDAGADGAGAGAGDNGAIVTDSGAPGDAGDVDPVAQGVTAGDVEAGDNAVDATVKVPAAEDPGAESASRPPSVESAAQSLRRAYRDLAAAAPEQYVRVAPLGVDDGLPAEVVDEIAAALRKRSPSRAVGAEDLGSGDDATGGGTADGTTDDAAPSGEGATAGGGSGVMHDVPAQGGSDRSAGDEPDSGGPRGAEPRVDDPGEPVADGVR